MGVAGGDGVGGYWAIRERTYLGGEPSTLFRLINLPLLLKGLYFMLTYSSSFSSRVLYLSTWFFMLQRCLFDTTILQ
jgi:hypothetical protein